MVHGAVHRHLPQARCASLSLCTATAHHHGPCPRPEDFKRVLWSEFCQLHDELERYLEEVSDQLITRAIGSDGNDNDSTLDAR